MIEGVRRVAFVNATSIYAAITADTFILVKDRHHAARFIGFHFQSADGT